MPVNEKTPRPLLPRTSPNIDAASDASSGPSQGVQDTSSQSRTRNLQLTRNNIRSACLACRQRRSKCSGGTPCTRCQARDTECVYEESQDRRTRAVRDKGKEELELHKKVIEGVFRAIRAGGEQAVLDLIREDASLRDIAAAIDEEVSVTESEPDEEQVSGYDASIIEETPASTTQDYPPMAHLMEEHATMATSMSNTAGSENEEHDLTSTTDFQTTNPHSALSGHGLQVARQRILHSNYDQILYQSMLEPLHDLTHSTSDSLSHFYIQFRDTSQQMMAQGVPAGSILGSEAVSCNLLFRARQSSDQFNLSTWASAVVNSFPDLDVYFKLAWLVLLVRFMRWSIDTSEQNYERLPDTMKPTALQVSIPHAPYIDLVPLPVVRDSLIRNFGDFTTALRLAGASVEWQAPFEAAVYRDPSSGLMTITENFEKHAANARNYTFGRFILQVLPELEGQVNVSELDRITSIRAQISRS